MATKSKYTYIERGERVVAHEGEFAGLHGEVTEVPGGPIVYVVFDKWPGDRRAVNACHLAEEVDGED